jgi:predicted nuclease of predicted toxin-antitoxin system
MLSSDEHLPEEQGELVRGTGHDALTVRAQGKSDSTVFEVSCREGRAFITLDRDFTDMRRYAPAERPGHIVLRLARQDKCHILSHFAGVVRPFESQPLTGHLWIVEENQVRIRS